MSEVSLYISLLHENAPMLHFSGASNRAPPTPPKIPGCRHGLMDGGLTPRKALRGLFPLIRGPEGVPRS